MLDTLAVVPIFVNAGTALIPAILAPLASVMALLLRPRELLRAIRQHPWAATIAAVCIAGTWWGVAWVLQSPTPARRTQHTAPPRIDWVKEAKEIIRRGGHAGRSTAAVRRDVDTPRHAMVFRYDYTRCGHGGGPVPLDLKPSWEFKPEGAMFLSSPLVVGDRVYGASSTIDPIGGNCGTIFCLNSENGRVIWELKDTDGNVLKPFFSSPAITKDGKFLIIGQGLHDDADSHLICLEAQSGTVHWQIRTPLHIEGSPAILDDVVIAGAGAIEGPDHHPKAGTDPGFVLAVRISDGQELWRYRINDPESSPAIGEDGTVYIGSGFQGNAVLALRSETDEELKRKGIDRLMWKTTTPYPATGAVTLIGDMVIVGAGNGDYVYADPHPAGIVMALDARTGVIRWKTDMSDAVLGAVAARDGRVICPVRNGEVVALRLSDGARLWQQPISDKAPVLAAPAYAGRTVYAVSKDGYLAVIDADDGRRIERHYLNDPGNPGAMGLTLSSPTIAAGCVFVGSETGGLRCFVGGKTTE